MMKKKERSDTTILVLTSFFLFLIIFSSTALAATAQSSSPTIHAYITNSDDNTVSVIDTATDTITATVPVGIGPYGVAVTPNGSKVYVTNNNSNTVSVIDTVTNRVTDTIEVEQMPRGVVVSPDGTKAYVTNFLSNNVSVIDTATNTVAATVKVESGPEGITVNPTGTKVYVTNWASDTVSIIDTATNIVISNVPVGKWPMGIAVTPDGSKVYLANEASNTTSVIDTATNLVIATVPVGNRPSGVAINPNGKKVYVTNEFSSNFSIIETSTDTVTASIYVLGFPEGIAVNPTGSKIYVTNWASNTVSVIDTATNIVTNTVSVGKAPIAFGKFIGSVPIKALTLPFADFSTNVTSGYAPLAVQFKDISQNAELRFWDFGDGTNSTEQEPVHTYSTSSTYNVVLTVSNANGTVAKAVPITVQTKSTSSGGSSHNSGSSSGGSSGSGSSSGGGGGAGGSPEPAKNVKVKELSQVFITSGKPIKFEFTRNATAIVSLNFDSRKTVAKTTTIVEMLKNKSILTPEAPEGEVYNYLNIWVGNGGYGSDEDNLENAVVNFRVEKSWVQDKGIDQDSITLNRYSDKKWNELSTTLVGEDNKYLYLKAEAPGFSPFAITGTLKGFPENITEEEQSTEIEKSKTEKPTNPSDKDNTYHFPDLSKLSQLVMVIAKAFYSLISNTIAQVIATIAVAIILRKYGYIMSTPTATTLISSVNESKSGQPITFTATVKTSTLGTEVPSGTVTFMDGTTSIGTENLKSGQATLITSFHSVGSSHAVIAEYHGNSNFKSSKSSLLEITVLEQSK